MKKWTRAEKALLVTTTLGLGLLVLQFNNAKKQEIASLLAPIQTQSESKALSMSSQSPLDPPRLEDIAKDELGDAILQGYLIVTQTRKYAKGSVGNTLNCTSCHLNGGRKNWAAPWVGIWGVFPEYRSRSGRINSLEDRINDCFERSMNGKRLPENSDTMVSILSYMRWLSSRVPTGTPIEGRGFKKIKRTREPNLDEGKKLYQARCVACHGLNGEGQQQANGGYLFPPLWGSKSFNIGAGMARLNTAASFIKQNMPLGQEGTLSEQEAFDIAAYFTQQPRPDFQRKHLDWPKGNKPEDARY